jgi:CelD/BcsL family acetyltransferase involved in cellulose biosynthesis
MRAILPLEERVDRSFVERGKGFPVRVLGMPWNETWPLTDAIGPEDDARRALLPAVVQHLRSDARRPALLVLGRARDGSVLWDGLAALPRGAAYAFADGGECVVPTDVTVGEFDARLSAKGRKKLKRARESHARLPGANWVRAVDREDLLREYAHFVEVEASGWKGRHGSAIRQRPESDAFYRALLEGLHLDGHCEIHALCAEGRTVSASLCVFTRNRGVILKSGYDESYARVAPGRVREQLTLEWACGSPEIEAVSQLSDAPWLRLWHPEVNTTLRAYVALRPISGRSLLLAYRVRYGPVRAFVRAHKERLRQRDDRSQMRRGRDAE